MGELRDAEFYKRACLQQNEEIARTLAIALHFPRGPFPEICGVCEGVCTMPDECRNDVIWGEHTAESLALMAADRIAELEKGVRSD